jgi:hypothetical protein
MDADLPIPDRLKAGAPGLGAPSEAEIEQRAIELATADGRDAFTDVDLARAAAELGGGEPGVLAPEADEPVVEKLESWDEPVDQHGHQMERTGLDDEAMVSEQLMEDGLEEADHNQRVAAAEEANEEGEE